MLCANPDLPGRHAMALPARAVFNAAPALWNDNQAIVILAIHGKHARSCSPAIRKASKSSSWALIERALVCFRNRFSKNSATCRRCCNDKVSAPSSLFTSSKSGLSVSKHHIGGRTPIFLKVFAWTPFRDFCRNCHFHTFCYK